MTKDEMRAMLSTLVPQAIADGRAYRFNRVGNGKAHLPQDHIPVSEVPNARAKIQVQTKPARPMRMFPRQGVNGAGFKVPTFKPLQGVDPTHKPFPINSIITHTPFFCSVCDSEGKNCTC